MATPSGFHRLTNHHHATQQNGKTTFAMPSIIDSHDMGLTTVLQSRCPKRNAYSKVNQSNSESACALIVIRHYLFVSLLGELF
ncbi:hypothetical protein TNCV_2148251 [Trichonephila clavipes]|uniref:Uncharacterized protein n=1 Tax=Trichonephila clavipes TaxID=2585209 RepID=A0A8X6SU93_TRICX|nr:hypothetical protein TNCV_2148251 [Trichonephila clavipes]